MSLPELTKIRFFWFLFPIYHLSLINLQLRDCWQITFITLNGFCSLSKKSPTLTPCSWQTLSWWLEYQPKSNEKYIPFLHCISTFLVLKVRWYFLEKFLRSSCNYHIFYFLFFLLAFTSDIRADIIFHKFLVGAPTSIRHFFHRSVCLSVGHRTSGTIHHLTIVFGTHVKWLDLQEFFHFFLILIFWVVRRVKGQKIAQNEK